jgi:hypothetical protein
MLEQYQRDHRDLKYGSFVAAESRWIDPMRLVRTILAFAIAASLVMLPLGASATAILTPTGDAHTSIQVGASNEMSMDCCPDDVKGVPSHTDGYKCNMGICCIGGAVALGDVRSIAFHFPSVTATKIAIPVDQVVSSRGGSPPFRPPRV